MSTIERAIEAARALRSEGGNTEYDRALVELICDTFPIGDKDSDQKRAYVEGLLNGAPEDNTFKSIAGSERDSITLKPFVEESGTVQWELYIPLTHESQFHLHGWNDPEDGVEQVPLDPEVALIPPPYGAMHWDSLSAATASLSLAVRQGLIKFNDGRTIE